MPRALLRGGESIAREIDLEFHIGGSKWEELGAELERILGTEQVILILAVGFVEESRVKERGHHEEHIHPETTFAESVKKMARRLRGDLA